MSNGFQSELTNGKFENNEPDNLAERTKAIQELRDKIAVKPEVGQNTEDKFLLQFLRAKDFDKDSAFQLLCRYYEFRRDNKSIFTELTIPELRYVLEDGFPCFLPNRNEDGAKIMVLFAGTWDIEKYQLEEIMKAIILSLEHASEVEENQKNGFVLIVDFSGWNSTHASQLKISSVKQLVGIFQECFPIRFKGIHLINQPWYINAVVLLSRTFIKGNQQLKVYLHGNNLTTLHEHLHTDFLPAEFGGNKPEVDQSYWLRCLLASHDHKPVVHGKNPLRLSVVERCEVNISETTALLNSID